MGKSPFQAAIDAARELVGPIIAMTITLAAVYAPIGIQGGLTGALFREFAFTLAGAVIVSGVVALTLSPMMGSKLLRPGDTERGFRGNRQPPLRERAQPLYAPAVGNAYSYRPVVLTLWVIVALLMVPFYMFSQRELAPAEDQGSRVRYHSVFRQLDPGPDKSVYRAGLRRLSLVPGEREHLPDHDSRAAVSAAW